MKPPNLNPSGIRPIIFILSFLFMVGCNNNNPTSNNEPQKETIIKQPDRGDFIIKFNEEDEMASILKAELNHDNLFTSLIQQLNENFNLPHDLPITFGYINEINAMYLPESKNILFGYEFVKFFKLLFEKEYDDQREIWDATRNTVYFFLLHEIGHALVDIYQISSAANPEDLADNFSIYMLTGNNTSTDVLLDGASYFQIMTKYQAEYKLEDLPVLDEHGLDPQRYFNLICKIYASDPIKYQSLVTEGYLNEEKVPLAKSMFKSNNDAWNKDLAMWIKN